MQIKKELKDLFWIGASKKELGTLPDEVVDDTYRAVYTVRFKNAVYVLHCFQKKSTQGIKTPRPNLDMIKERLKAAKAHAEGENNG